MNRDQAIHNFWSSFEWKAYDETSVPDDAVLPYITHEGSVNDFGYAVAQNASLWIRSTDWTEILAKLDEIENAITRGGIMLSYDRGAVWLKKGDPWAQRMGDSTDDMIRRVLISYELEFID